MISISLANVEDAEDIRNCLMSAFAAYRSQYTDGAFQDTVPPVPIVEARITGMAVYVARAAANAVVGTISSSIDAGKDGHLRGMAVVPAWHGHGIADRLLKAAEENLVLAGCRVLTLDTTAPLERAIRFYEKRGFARSGKITDFFGMPLYEYVKYLKPGQH